MQRPSEAREWHTIMHELHTIGCDMHVNKPHKMQLSAVFTLKMHLCRSFVHVKMQILRAKMQMSASRTQYCAQKGKAKGRRPVALPFGARYCVGDARYAGELGP